MDDGRVPSSPWRRRVATSTLALATVGLFDLVTTLLLLRLGMAEGNPIFAHILAQHGSHAFVGAKVLCLAGPIAILEWARTKHPKSADQGAWLAFVAYFGLYGYQLWRLGTG